jgi:hypothetical protein
MKRTIGILGIALLLSCGGARVFAQADESKSKASEKKIETAPTTYRLTYTLAEVDGGKRIGTQHFALTVNPLNTGRIKLGSKVPIATGSSKPENAILTQYQYHDVGLNISARIREIAEGVSLDSNVEQTSFSEVQSSVGINDPVIRQARLENTSLLTPGKPMMLGSLDVPGSTRHLDVEVVVEVVR